MIFQNHYGFVLMLHFCPNQQNKDPKYIFTRRNIIPGKTVTANRNVINLSDQIIGINKKNRILPTVDLLTNILKLKVFLNFRTIHKKTYC